MADLTKAQLAARVLQKLGVLGVGSSATAADTALVEEEIDSAHSELRKEGLAPFATSAIPDWAQRGLMDFVIAEVGPSFGRPANTEALQRRARMRLSRQLAGFKHIPVRATYY